MERTVLAHLAYLVMFQLHWKLQNAFRRHYRRWGSIVEAYWGDQRLFQLRWRYPHTVREVRGSTSLIFVNVVLSHKGAVDDFNVFFFEDTI